MKQLTTLLLIAVCFSACKKDEIVLTSSPYIEFVSLSPASVQEYSEAISFTIFYQDGDGDLGENVAGVKNLFLTDQRNNITYEYRIEQLAPSDANIAIQGKITIELNNTGITDGSNEQSATYSIYVVDRAGHKSNTIESSPLNIYK